MHRVEANSLWSCDLITVWLGHIVDLGHSWSICNLLRAGPSFSLHLDQGICTGPVLGDPHNPQLAIGQTCFPQRRTPSPDCRPGVRVKVDPLTSTAVHEMLPGCGCRGGSRHCHGFGRNKEIPLLLTLSSVLQFPHV